MDYPFRLSSAIRQGRQGGRQIWRGRDFIDKNNNLVLENYGQQPTMFSEIKRLK
jgi:hypothetical protein